MRSPLAASSAGSTLRALRSRCRSCSPVIGSTCRWTCGTSNPATSSPTRGGENARWIACPITCDTVMRWALSAGSASSQWSTSTRGTTSVWPGWIGLIDRKATHSGSRQTNVPGISPSMMRVKIVGTRRIVCAGRERGRALQVSASGPPITRLMTTAPLTDRRFLRRSAPPAPERVASGQFRPSASHPIPPLRSVAVFVALPSTRRYVTVKGKFLIALGGAALWLLLAVIVSLAFLGSLAEVVSWPAAVLMAIFVVYVPAYLTAFSCIGIVLDDPPALEIVHPTTPVTVVVRSDRQPKDVVVCLAYLAAQDYDGPLSVLLVDHASTDDTVAEACRAARQLELDLKVVVERRDGRAHAYNTGLACVDTPVFVTLDAGTFLHPSAVRLLVARLMSSPSDTAAVAGHAFVRNARQGTFAEYEATDYALA